MQTRRQFIGSAVGAAAILGVKRAAHGSPVPLLISVLTCPRPHGASYLDGTLAAVDADVSADVPRLLVCDGEEVLRNGWISVVLPPRHRERGPHENKKPGWVAMRTAWEMGADLLFLEDDIRAIRRGAFASMVAHRVPDAVAFTSFFGNGRLAGTYPGRDFRWSQAVKIPRRSLELLARAETDIPHALSAVTWIDLAIGMVSRANDWSFKQTTSLVEHIGLWSAANPIRKDPSQ